MICMIDARHAPDGILNPLPYGTEDTLVFNEGLREVRVCGPLRIRNLIVPNAVRLIVEGPLSAMNLAVGAVTAYGGIEADLLTAQGDVLVEGGLFLGSGKAEISKRLMVKGDVRAEAPVKVWGCTRISGTATLTGDLFCEDAWVPSLGLRSRSAAQKEAGEVMDLTFGTSARNGLFSRLRKLVA